MNANPANFFMLTKRATPNGLACVAALEGETGPAAATAFAFNRSDRMQNHENDSRREWQAGV